MSMALWNALNERIARHTPSIRQFEAHNIAHGWLMGRGTHVNVFPVETGDDCVIWASVRDGAGHAKRQFRRCKYVGSTPLRHSFVYGGQSYVIPIEGCEERIWRLIP